MLYLYIHNLRLLFNLSFSYIERINCMNSEKAEKKRHDELQAVTRMIEIYCRGKHGHNISLCKDCQKLMDYARSRIEYCPFMESKSFCSNCMVHCYSPDMRVKIKEVMRYSGPRIMFYYPAMCIKHAFTSLTAKLKI